MITSPSRSTTDDVIQVEISMVSTMVNGDIIGETWASSTTLVHMSYLLSRRGRQPWVMTVLAVVMLVLRVDDLPWFWVYLLYSLTCYMEVSTRSKPWLRSPTAVKYSSGAFLRVLAIDFILEELVLISVLLSAAIDCVREIGQI